MANVTLELEDLSPKLKDPTPKPKFEELLPKFKKKKKNETLKLDEKIVIPKAEDEILTPSIEVIKPKIIEVIPDPKIEERKAKQLRILSKLKSKVKPPPKPPVELSPTSKLAIELLKGAGTKPIHFGAESINFGYNHIGISDSDSNNSVFQVVPDSARLKEMVTKKTDQNPSFNKAFVP